MLLGELRFSAGPPANGPDRMGLPRRLRTPLPLRSPVGLVTAADCGAPAGRRCAAAKLLKEVLLAEARGPVAFGEPGLWRDQSLTDGREQ